MSINKFKPYLIVVPEDEAYRDIALIFKRLLPPPLSNQVVIKDCIQGGRKVAGWKKALDYIDDFDSLNDQYGHLVVLIDFDDAGEIRKKAVDQAIEKATHKANRVFVLGAKSEAEQIKNLGPIHDKSWVSAEKDLLSCTDAFGNTDQLQHNHEMLSRLCPILRDTIMSALGVSLSAP